MAILGDITGNPSEARVHVYNVGGPKISLSVVITHEGIIIDVIHADEPDVLGTECREWPDILHELTGGNYE